jgi:Golgi phosphoprotein 3 (GPP34)
MTAGVTTEKIRAQDKLAARLFLILHDPFNGRCAVSPMALRCALVGAELAELVLNRRVTMVGELVVLGATSAPGRDALSAFVVGAIARQPESYGVPTWLAAIGDAVVELVAARLVEAEILARSKSPLRRRGRGRFPATDLLAAAGPRVRLEYMVRQPEDCDVAGAACAGLVAAVGAGRVLQGSSSRRQLRSGLATVAATLPDDLRSLVTSVEVAHASGALPPSLRLRPRD